MSRGRKLIALLLLLALPLAIFLFLYLAGDNVLTMPSYSLPQEGCTYQQVNLAPAASATMRITCLRDSTAAAQDEAMARLDRNLKELYPVQIDFLGDLQSRQQAWCLLGVGPTQDTLPASSLVLVDQHGTPRGYYDPAEREQVDDLILEVSVLNTVQKQEADGHVKR